MNELKRFERFVSGLGVALFVVLSDLLGFSARAQSLPIKVSAILSLTGVAVSYFLFRFAAEGLVRGSWRIRKRLLGIKFVEGMWREVVVPYDERDAAYISAARISYDHDRHGFRYSGENFTTEGIPMGSFKSDMVVLDWPEVKFKYTWKRPCPGESTEGYGEFGLLEAEGEPGFYDGFFADLGDGSRSVFLGWRMADRPSARKLSDALKDPSSMRETMHQWADDTKEYWGNRQVTKQLRARHGARSTSSSDRSESAEAMPSGSGG